MERLPIDRRGETEYQFELTANSEFIQNRAAWVADPSEATFDAYQAAKEELIADFYDEGYGLIFDLETKLNREGEIHYTPDGIVAFRDLMKNFLYSMIIAAYVERNAPPRPRFMWPGRYEQKKREMRWDASLGFVARWEELMQGAEEDPEVSGVAAVTLVSEQLEAEEAEIRQQYGI